MTEIGDLFENPEDSVINIVPGMVLLKRFTSAAALVDQIQAVCEQAPTRNMQTRRGFSMSVAMTNCGQLGWVSDRKGYRYSPKNPETNQPWPAMPNVFSELAHSAAAKAGFENFEPDACLINCYKTGAQMGAHQDRNEKDFSQPIVSASVGVDARFFVRNESNTGKSMSFTLQDGDVVVFGAQARHCFHGVRPLKPGNHPIFGSARWNLTFRRAS